MSDTKIIMTVSDLQEKLDEVIDERITVHITYDDSEEIVAVLVPIESYEEIMDEIDYLESELQRLNEDY